MFHGNRFADGRSRRKHPRTHEHARTIRRIGGVGSRAYDQRVPDFASFLARLRAEPDPAPPSRYGPYRSYGALFEAVERVRAASPGSVVEMYGRSTRGEPLWAVRL